MVYFLEHLPKQVNLVIATRSDPALPLALLRGRRDLDEIRAADLRFTSSEADADNRAAPLWTYSTLTK